MIFIFNTCHWRDVFYFMNKVDLRQSFASHNLTQMQQYKPAYTQITECAELSLTLCCSEEIISSYFWWIIGS